MRYSLLIFIFLILPIKVVKSNNSFSRIGGFSLYDLYLSNPSFISSDNLVSFNLYGRAYLFNQFDDPLDLMINSLVSIDKIKSAFLSSYYYSQLGFSKDHGFNLGYSFNHRFNKNLILKFGVGYNFIQRSTDWSNFIDNIVDDSRYYLSKGKTHHLDLGLGIVLYGLTFGLNNNITLSEKIIYQDHTLPDSTSTSGSEYNYLNILAKYDFTIREKFTITPQLDYNKIFKSYLSLFLTYIDKYRIGLTYNLSKNSDFSDFKIMFSSSCIIADKVELIVFFNPGFQKPYDSLFGWNLASKIGVKF